MPMWRCPHCGTPQAETARCWVCRRSSTACGTCRNFRRSVAAQLGYCGLDRQRRPLTGDEIRACWEATASPAEVPAAIIPQHAESLDGPRQDRTPVRRLEFVEVRSSRPAAGRGSRATTAGQAGRMPASSGADPESDADVGEEPPVAHRPADPAWSLWGDSDL
jgi:hypothetical protein